MKNDYYFGQTAKLKMYAVRDRIGVTGLNVLVSIRRLSDNFYFQSDQVSFSGNFAVNNASELDNIREPGVYQYNFAQNNDETSISGIPQGYLVRFSSVLGEQVACINYESGVARQTTLLLTSGQLANAIAQISISGTLTSGSVADAVWNALLNDHTISGTFGFKLGQDDIRAFFI